MHGNRSNIILFEKEEVSELFKKNIPLDQQIKLTFLDRDIDWSYETFVKHHENPEKLYFTFGKLIWQYLESLEFQNKHVEQKWELICDIRKAFDAGRFYITTWKGATVLSLLKIGTIQQEFSEPIKAISEFYYTFTQVYVLQQEKGKLTSTINSRIQSSRNYIKKSFAKLEELTKEDNYKNWADIVMANLHVIQPGIEKVKLHDFYNNNELVEIKLKKDLNAQKNAELFYKKSKNQNIELTFLKEAIQKKEKDIQELETQLCTIEQFNDLKAFRQFASAIKTDNSDISEERHLPYHEFLFGGYRIWVGKNAQANDELTQRLSFKEDLWLHAKDVTGSHVLIKYQAGKNFPKDVIERAAQLAAYNSKRRNETLCPVIVTPKKFVRKKKGDPAGAVVIEREDIIMVEPKL
nr:NFACT RNA binding domain-containing protein [Chryseosolibacter indicus]